MYQRMPSHARILGTTAFPRSAAGLFPTPGPDVDRYVMTPVSSSNSHPLSFRMAIGNNSNKKKKIIVRTKPDPYLRKEWYNVKAPPMFKHNDIGQTPVLKTAGLRVASEVIKGRIYESNLGDLAENEAVNGNIKFYFKAVETKDNSSLTDFYGYSITRHKLQSLFRKRCSKIDSVVDVQTKDGYLLRVFAIAFTDKDEKSYSQNCYAKTS